VPARDSEVVLLGTEFAFLQVKLFVGRGGKPMSFKSLVPWRRGEVSRGRDPFTGLQHEINEVFDRFFGADRFFGSGERPAWPTGFVPDVDVTETDTEVRVTADVPGVDEKALEVTLGEGTLAIKGEKKTEKEEKDKGRHYVERSYGAFERRIELPCEVDANKVKAEYKKGVLTVTLQKTAKTSSSTKKIAISAGG
jgi:HSP20 family protein